MPLSEINTIPINKPSSRRLSQFDFGGVCMGSPSAKTPEWGLHPGVRRLGKWSCETLAQEVEGL